MVVTAKTVVVIFFIFFADLFIGVVQFAPGNIQVFGRGIIVLPTRSTVREFVVEVRCVPLFSLCYRYHQAEYSGSP